MSEMRDWEPAFTEMGAVYKRPTDQPDAPHLKALKSPTHTDMYFNSDIVEQDVAVMGDVADEWAAVLLDRGEEPQRVVGHAPYAIAPAYELTKALRARGLPVRFGYAMRDSKYVEHDKRVGYSTTFPIEEGERVTAIADDVVSGDSTRRTINDLVSKGAVVLPSIPCLANLSGAGDLDGRPFIAASTFRPNAYKVMDDKCGLCALGSAALQPRLHWAELQSWMTAAG